MGMCKVVNLNLEGVNLLVNFHIFSLEGVDVILGVSLLRTLGNISFNWDHLSMEFKYKGQKVLVKSVTKMSMTSKVEKFEPLLTKAGL